MPEADLIEVDPKILAFTHRSPTHSAALPQPYSPQPRDHSIPSFTQKLFDCNLSSNNQNNRHHARRNRPRCRCEFHPQSHKFERTRTTKTRKRWMNAQKSTETDIYVTKKEKTWIHIWFYAREVHCWNKQADSEIFFNNRLKNSSSLMPIS